jgi:hypothetical protein
VALNEVQVLGSHNSYHVQPRPALLAALLALTPAFEAWEYTHPPLDEQFESEGIRQIELDVYADPAGGLYSRRGGLLAIGEDPESGIRRCRAGAQGAAHSRPRLREQLSDVRRLPADGEGVVGRAPAPPADHDPGRDRAGHPPRSLQLRLRHADSLRCRRARLDRRRDPLGLSAAAVDHAGSHTPRSGDLEQAVLNLGWPRLGALRGQVLFALDNGGTTRATTWPGTRRWSDG